MKWKNFNFTDLNANDTNTIMQAQSELGINQSGKMDRTTIKALQRMVGTKDDGGWGDLSRDAASAWLKNNKSSGLSNFTSNLVDKARNLISKPEESDTTEQPERNGFVRGLFDTISSRKNEDTETTINEKSASEKNKKFDSLTAEQAQSLYQSASPGKVRSAISASVPLAKILFSSGKRSSMDNKTKNQLAVALTYYKDKINTVDSLNDLGEHGSKERIKKLSPIGYQHEGFLSGQDANVNVQDITGNPLSRVLGNFGTVKDKNGTFLVDDDYDNEIYRIPKDLADSLNIKGLHSGGTKDPNHYIVTRDQFDKLKEAGILKDSRWDAIKYTAKALGKEIAGKPEFSDESWSQRLKKIGENAIVRTGNSQKFDFTMSEKERLRRIGRLQNRQNRRNMVRSIFGSKEE